MSILNIVKDSKNKSLRQFIFEFFKTMKDKNKSIPVIILGALWLAIIIVILGLGRFWPAILTIYTGCRISYILPFKILDIAGFIGLAYWGLFKIQKIYSKRYKAVDQAQQYQADYQQQQPEIIEVQPQQHINYQPQPETKKIFEVYEVNKPNKNSFDGIIGLDTAKMELIEAVEDMLNEEDPRYKVYEVEPRKGILLYGPQGCGKTSVVRALAEYFGLPFIYIEANQLVKELIGQSGSNIDEIFAEAEKRRKGKICIIYFNEFDFIAMTRSKGSVVTEETLGRLLTKMDGMKKLEGVLVIADTNRIDILDPAIKRPGRFDQRINIDYPDCETRNKIIRHYMENKPSTLSDADYDELAYIDNLSPAIIKAAVNEAAKAVRREDKVLGEKRYITKAILYQQLIIAYEAESKDREAKNRDLSELFN